MEGETQTIEATRWGRKIPESAELEARRRRLEGEMREKRRNWGRNAANSVRRLTLVGEQCELRLAEFLPGGDDEDDGGEATQRVHWPTTATPTIFCALSQSLTSFASLDLIRHKWIDIFTLYPDSSEFGFTRSIKKYWGVKSKKWLFCTDRVSRWSFFCTVYF